MGRHEYATDPSERQVINRRLALTSATLAVVLNYLLSTYVPRYEVIGWLLGPSSMGVIWGILYWWFDRYLWKEVVLGTPLSELHNLTGTWLGTVEPDTRHRRRARPEPRKAVALRIDQTWSKMLVEFVTLDDPSNPEQSPLSRSTSRMSMVYASTELGSDALNYEYVALRGSAGSARGSVLIRHIHENPPRLSGHYYTAGNDNDTNCRAGTLDYERRFHELLEDALLRQCLCNQQRQLNHAAAHTR